MTTSKTVYVVAADADKAFDISCYEPAKQHDDVRAAEEILEGEKCRQLRFSKPVKYKIFKVIHVCKIEEVS